MACRRTLTKQASQLRRWYHPSLSHITHHIDESEESWQSPISSRAKYGLGSDSLPRINNGSNLGGLNGGFGVLSVPSKCFPALFIPAGVGSSWYRFVSTSVEEGSDNVDHLGDAAELITDQTVEVVSSQAPVINEVAIAAADSAFPVAVLQYLIDGMHSLTGLNWWAAIALTTILIRAATLPFLINQLKATYKLNLIRPRMEEIKQRVQASGMDPTAVAEGQREMNSLLKQYGVSPFTPLKGLLIQGPVFISFFFAISNMVEKVPSFKNGGALWFTDLTTPDNLFIFPVLASLSFLVPFNMQEGFEGTPIARNMKKGSRFFAILAVPFTMAFPKALFCYWITSNLFSLSYGLAPTFRGIYLREASSCQQAAEAGMHIYSRASAKGKRVQSNMGAKNHAIVMPDANIDAAANALVAAGFGAAGQRCMALSTVVFVGDLRTWIRDCQMACFS